MFYIGSTKVGVCHREYDRHTQVNRCKEGKNPGGIGHEMVGQSRQISTFYNNRSQRFRHLCRSLDVWTCSYRTATSPIEPSHDYQKCFQVFLQTWQEKFSRNSFSIQIVQADQKKAFNIERIIRHDSNTTTGYLGNYVRFGIIHQTKIFDEQATPQWQIYQYYDIWIYSIRLSRKVEGPERSRIRSELKNIAKFRNMSWPMMTDKPLQIPFLAQSNFSETMKRWLKRFLRQRKDLGIPFHVQKCNIRAAAHSKVADILHNPFNWQDYHLSQID